MQKNFTQLPVMHLVGITARTNNIAEQNPETAKIGITMQKFFETGLYDKIPNRKNPGKIFAVYTNYESDFEGDYTYLIGEEVISPSEDIEGLESITIPNQAYAKFTSDPEQMPDVVIDMWQKIWKMNASDFGNERAYIADFEVYDDRSKDPKNAIVDIYIGINK